MRTNSLLLSIAFLAVSASMAHPEESSDLAKQLANPVSSLVSVPFQENWDFGVGPENDTRFLINFQPVMPFVLNDKWNLIARVIVPILSQPPLASGGAATFGVSDILLSTFFSPSHAQGLIWGLGPILQLPTTSDPTLGTGKWAAGPTLVLVKQAGPWTYGMLMNQLWSYAGDEDRNNVNQTFLQPFLSHTMGAVTVTLSSESTGNWEAPSGDEWTVPINLTASKVCKLGQKPISLALGGGVYAEKPDGGPEWKLRMVLTLLFPTAAKK